MAIPDFQLIVTSSSVTAIDQSRGAYRLLPSSKGANAGSLVTQYIYPPESGGRGPLPKPEAVLRVNRFQRANLLLGAALILQNQEQNKQANGNALKGGVAKRTRENAAQAMQLVCSGDCSQACGLLHMPPAIAARLNRTDVGRKLVRAVTALGEEHRKTNQSAVMTKTAPEYWAHKKKYQGCRCMPEDLVVVNCDGLRYIFNIYAFHRRLWCWRSFQDQSEAE
jgi:hypothetical protein